MQGSEDLYETLQVHPSADPEVIAAAYRRLALKYHPDRNKSPQAPAMMQRLNQAYEVLSDPSRRSAYDLDRAERKAQEEENPWRARETTAGGLAGAQPSAEQQAQIIDELLSKHLRRAPFWRRPMFLIFVVTSLLGSLFLQTLPGDMTQPTPKPVPTRAAQDSRLSQDEAIAKVKEYVVQSPFSLETFGQLQLRLKGSRAVETTAGWYTREKRWLVSFKTSAGRLDNFYLYDTTDVVEYIGLEITVPTPALDGRDSLVPTDVSTPTLVTTPASSQIPTPTIASTPAPKPTVAIPSVPGFAVNFPLGNLLEDPPQIIISRGTTVIWINTSAQPQYIESCSTVSCSNADGQWSSEAIQPGSTYSRTFNQVGIFYYRKNGSADHGSLVIVQG